MNILGVSFDYHDAAAVLLSDHRIVAAAQEERFTRKKHDASLPARSIEFCLRQASIRAIDVDYVVHYENPFLKLARILWASRQADTETFKPYLWSALSSWMQKRKLEVRHRLAEHLGLPRQKIVTLLHHESHAASAFFCSPFERSTIVTLDGVGEFETASVSLGSGIDMQRLQSIHLPHSLGLFYTAFTAYLGFEVNEGEYKVMGMAAFGQPIFYNEVRQLVALHSDGSFTIDQNYFNFLIPSEDALIKGLVALFGPPRKAGSEFRLDASCPKSSESQRFADIAASVQRVTEEVMLHVVSHAVSRTQVRDVCLAGGCALNSLANRRIEKELGCRLFVQPAAGDAGGAMGAVLYYYHVVLRQPRIPPLTHVFLGPAFTHSQIELAIEKEKLNSVQVCENDVELVRVVAKLIAGGAVVGWFQGSSEWGPRALGCRSILADPTRAEMKQVVNEKIKFREGFRPFAPAVLVERVHEFFDLREVTDTSAPENFMLLVCDVRSDAKDRIPAVTHVDGTARVQVVRREVNPLFYSLIREFEVNAGVPVLLNTSFNLRGEPIVDSPLDAIRTFAWSDMDYLVMGHHVIKKKYSV